MVLNNKKTAASALYDELKRYYELFSKGNKKYIVYLMGQRLFFNKNSKERVEALRALNKLIEYYEDSNTLREKKSNR
jgi:hypothetical protein